MTSHFIHKEKGQKSRSAPLNFRKYVSLYSCLPYSSYFPRSLSRQPISGLFSPCLFFVALVHLATLVEGLFSLVGSMPGADRYFFILDLLVGLEEVRHFLLEMRV